MPHDDRHVRRRCRDNGFAAARSSIAPLKACRRLYDRHLRLLHRHTGRLFIPSFFAMRKERYLSSPVQKIFEYFKSNMPKIHKYWCRLTGSLRLERHTPDKLDFAAAAMRHVDQLRHIIGEIRSIARYSFPLRKRKREKETCRTLTCRCARRVCRGKSISGRQRKRLGKPLQKIK
ncbi:hypothetical protein PUN28_015913 [Cardiocondyla obscurior]|uniref:Uncharacterized protein n=1 Tax=Cardiocondyla obscurior TaxID=286306 RepID=A0AAW2EQ20_9HYME